MLGKHKRLLSPQVSIKHAQTARLWAVLRERKQIAFSMRRNCIITGMRGLRKEIGHISFQATLATSKRFWEQMPHFPSSLYLIILRLSNSHLPVWCWSNIFLQSHNSHTQEKRHFRQFLCCSKYLVKFSLPLNNVDKALLPTFPFAWAHFSFCQVEGLMFFFTLVLLLRCWWRRRRQKDRKKREWYLEAETVLTKEVKYLTNKFYLKEQKEALSVSCVLQNEGCCFNSKHLAFPF